MGLATPAEAFERKCVGLHRMVLAVIERLQGEIEGMAHQTLSEGRQEVAGSIKGL